MRDYDGKTAAERVAQRREQLIEAGFDVFGTQGYSSASIRMVLERAGLRARYFGESFADLDELMAAVFDRVVDGELDRGRAAMAAGPGGTETARAVVQALVDYLDEDPRRARIKLREILAAGPVSRRHRRSAQERIGALLAGLFPPPAAGSSHDPQVFGLALAASGYELLIALRDGFPGMTRQRVTDTQTMLYEGIVHSLATS